MMEMKQYKKQVFKYFITVFGKKEITPFTGCVKDRPTIFFTTFIHFNLLNE